MQNLKLISVLRVLSVDGLIWHLFTVHPILDDTGIRLKQDARIAPIVPARLSIASLGKFHPVDKR